MPPRPGDRADCECEVECEAREATGWDGVANAEA